MRVLIAPDQIRYGQDPTTIADAAEATTALVQGWQSARPQDQVTGHPLSDGATGLISAVAAAQGGSREVALACDPWGREQPVSWWRSGTTALIETGPLLGDPTGTDAEALAVTGSSAGVGEVLRAVLGAGVRRIVLGVGEGGTHDAGIGMLRAVAAVGPQTPLPEVVQQVHSLLAGVDVVVAAATDRPLVGLSGAGAALDQRPGIDAAAAQARELALAADVAQIEAAEPAHSSLLAGGGSQPRGSRRVGAGAGGGVAFALAAAGARVLPGAQVVAVETGLDAAVAAADLVLTGCSVLDGAAIADGVPGVVGSLGMSAMVPVVAIAGTVLVSRRELAGTGIEGVYPVLDPAGPGQVPEEPPSTSALVARATRVARTWSR